MIELKMQFSVCAGLVVKRASGLEFLIRLQIN